MKLFTPHNIGKLKIKNQSLRGNNRFVQMASIHISEGHTEFLNKYACTNKEHFTIATELIQGYGNSERDLLAFMVKKHHNIKIGSKKSYKDYILLNKAREPEKPIYLSYTPEDLLKVGSSAHLFAVYYAIGINQPIGAISLDKL